MNPFADGINNASTFIVKNNSTKKSISLFGLSLKPGNSYNLMNLEGVTENDIKVSLLKGVLKRKINTGELSITSTDIDLTTLNSTQLSFLQNNGVNYGIYPNNQIFKVLYPDSTIIDNFASLQSEISLAAYKYSLVFSSVNKSNNIIQWVCNTPLNLFSGTSIKLSKSTQIIKSTVPQPNISTDPFSGIFNCNSAATGNSGTLSSTPTLGSTTVNITGFVPSISKPIAIRHRVSCSLYDIIDVTGTGPYTVTLDRPIVFPWSSGDVVEEHVLIVKDITINGDDAKLSGLGNQAFEFARCNNVKVNNLHFVSTYGNPTGAAFGIDLGSRKCLLEDMSVDMTNASGSQNAYYYQSHEASVINRVQASNVPVGISLLDCWSSGINNSWVYKASSYGFLIASLAESGVASLGNFDCWVSGGGAIASSTGMYIYGSTRTSIDSWSAKKCTTYGILIEVGAHGEAVDSTKLTNINTSDCAIGILINTGVTNTLISNLDISGCTTYGLQSNAPVVGNGVTAKSSNSTANIFIQGSGESKINNGNIENTKSAGYGIISTATKIEISNTIAKMTGGGGCVAFYCAGGSMYIESCNGVGSTGGSIGFKVDGGCVGRIGPNCDLSNYEFPISITGTLYMDPYPGQSTVAMADANKTLTWAQYAVSIIKCTGGLTAARTITLPAITGYIWTIYNATTGGFNIVASGSSGTTINCAAGITRVYWDGTNMIQA